MKTFIQLRNEVINQIWPSGAPENLALPIRDADDKIIARAPLDLLMQEALSEIARAVTSEQEDNVNIVEFCKTFFKCGMTIVPAPRGTVRRVLIVMDENFCGSVFYRQKTFAEVEHWGRMLLQVTPPENAGMPTLPTGFKYAESSTDSPNGRALTGAYAIHERNLYIAPYIQSTEMVAIEWKGQKLEWGDNDPVNDEQLYKKAVKLYMQFAYERDYGDPRRADMFFRPDPKMPTGFFADALADLLWEETQRLKIRELPDFDNFRASLVCQATGVTPATTAAIGAVIYTGSAEPEGIQTANVGDEYNQIINGVFIAKWIKTVGDGNNTGWQ